MVGLERYTVTVKHRMGVNIRRLSRWGLLAPMRPVSRFVTLVVYLHTLFIVVSITQVYIIIIKLSQQL